MIPEARRDKIAEYIKRNKTVTIAQVSRQFNISEITIRRDLSKLENQGVIRKVYGGATTVNADNVEPFLAQRIQENTKEKKRIAAEALSRISDGDIVLIEAGTTCLELVKVLSSRKKLKVITAAPHILNALIDLKRTNQFDGDLLCCGGIWQEDPDDFFAGPQSSRFFEGLKIDIAFFGIFSIDYRDGWMTSNMFEVELTRTIIRASRRVVGLADHSKFNRTGFSKVGDIDEFDEIITDSGLDDRVLSTYAQKVKIVAV